MFLELDPTLLAVFGGTVMGVLQAVKPFMHEKYTLVALGAFSLVLAVILASTMEVAGFGEFLVQTIINAYLIVVSASGPYSIVKSQKNTDNPKGI